LDNDVIFNARSGIIFCFITSPAATIEFFATARTRTYDVYPSTSRFVASFKYFKIDGQTAVKAPFIRSSDNRNALQCVYRFVKIPIKNSVARKNNEMNKGTVEREKIPGALNGKNSGRPTGNELIKGTNLYERERESGSYSYIIRT